MNHCADVTLHIDETLDRTHALQFCDALRATEGVNTVNCAEHRDHLFVVSFDAHRITSARILDQATSQGLHAELIGL